MQGDGEMEYADYLAQCDAEAQAESDSAYAQMEAEEQNKIAENKLANKLIGNPDAKVWAEEFVKLLKEKPSIEIDEGLMIGWFANAIMAGYDKGHRDAETQTQGGQK